MGKKLSEMTLEELWTLFPIRLTEHNAKWKNQYEEMAIFLEHLLSSFNVIRISHIGSTAIGRMIKNAMLSHIDIFQYKEIELPTVFDGFINTFEFILDEKLTNAITAFNIWAFRENVNVGIFGTPSPTYKGSTVLQVFDEISKVLLDNG